MPIVLKSGSLNLLEPSGPLQECKGIALPLPGFDGLSGFPCHCRSNNNPHPNFICYVCYVILELDSVLKPDASVSLEFVFRPFIQQIQCGVCGLLLIVRLCGYKCSLKMDKMYSSIDLAEGISDETNSTKARDLNCLRADLTWFFGDGIR